ncbi:MAG: hypothetical protein OHK0039_41390 [Bacteroidia bacterium]
MQQYLNPFATLGLAPDSLGNPPDGDRLRLEKKRLLAEFELSRSATIALGHRQLDKSTVLRLFNQLEDPHIHAFHAALYREPRLLAFLEDATLDLFFSGDIALVYRLPEELRQFMAPYFAAQFNRRLLHAFRQNDWEEIDALCLHPLPIAVAHHAACYQDSHRLVHSRVQEIQQLAEQVGGGQTPGAEIQEVCDEMRILALNRLPDYFAALRDRYALALEALALAVHNTHRRVLLGVFIARQALKLRIGDETRARLEHILAQLQKLAPAESWIEGVGEHLRQGGGRQSWWFAAAGVGAVLLLLWLLS